jgi:hypothetical protein
MTPNEQQRLLREKYPSSIEQLVIARQSEVVGIEEAILLSGKSKATIRNRLSARDPLLLAARLPGKSYRFNRVRFMKWIEGCPEYATLPGIKRSRSKG